MKRYKLLKDLPTFKAGDEFFLNNIGDLEWDNKCGVNVIAYVGHTLEKFPNILKDWFEEIPEQPKTVWDLEEGDEYWGINLSDITGFDIDEYDFNLRAYHLREIGDVFLTREEAQKELARRKAKQILLRDTKGFKPDWNDRKGSYQVYYDRIYKSLDYGWCDIADGTIRFKNKIDAEASMKAHEKEWKIYLGVEE